MEHTKRQLFQPFQWGQWMRLAVLGLVTGEVSSAGGCNSFHLPSLPREGGSGSQQFLAGRIPHLDPSKLGQMLGAIVIVAIVALVLILVLLYINSICRFILFESVLTKRCRLRAGWQRWRKPGRSFFLWQLVYQIVLSMSMVVMVGIPVGIAFAAGWLREPKQHLLPLLLGGIILFFVFVVFILFAMLIRVLAKDFLVPIMALENLDFADGWNRLLAMLGSERGGYAGYIGMKVVLGLAAALAMGFVAFFVILLVALPVGGLGAIAVITGKTAGLTWNAFTITLAVVVGALALAGLLYLLALVAVPVAVFFPAYSIHFLASRYAPLDALLHPAPPPAPILPTVGPEPIG